MLKIINVMAIANTPSLSASIRVVAIHPMVDDTDRFILSSIIIAPQPGERSHSLKCMFPGTANGALFAGSAGGGGDSMQSSIHLFLLAARAANLISS